MLDIVLGYALLNILFELTVLVVFVPPRARLRLLGSSRISKTIHVGMFVFTLYVHWGSVLGTTGAFAAFPASILALFLAKQVFGFITDGVYHRRIIGYKLEELK